MKKRYSLFIGRYQPFHEGHKRLIETVLNEGRNVAIALRDTPVTDKDPFSYRQRKAMIRREMEKWGDRIKIIKIPDIEEVVFGREVGWGIRKIELDKETEEISATDIRKGL